MVKRQLDDETIERVLAGELPESLLYTDDWRRVEKELEEWDRENHGEKAAVLRSQIENKERLSTSDTNEAMSLIGGHLLGIYWSLIDARPGREYHGAPKLPASRQMAIDALEFSMRLAFDVDKCRALLPAIPSKKLQMQISEELCLIAYHLQGFEGMADSGLGDEDYDYAVKSVYEYLAAAAPHADRVLRLMARVEAYETAYLASDGDCDKSPTQRVAWQIYVAEMKDGVVDEARRTRIITAHNRRCKGRGGEVKRSSVLSQLSRYRTMGRGVDNDGK